MSLARAEAVLARARPAGWVLLVLLLGFVSYRGALQPDRGDTRFFRRGAERFAEREPLYKAVRGDASSPNTGYTYPPPFALAARPTLWVTPTVMRIVWPWLMGAFALGGYRALSRWSRERGRVELPVVTALLTVAIAGRYLWNDLRHGQTNLLVVGLLCVALLNARRGRDAWAAVALGLALVIKPTAWPLGVWFVVHGRWRLVGLCALTGIVALGVPALLYGPSAYAQEFADWVTRMGSFAREEALPSPELAANRSTLVNAAASAWAARGLHALGVASPVEGGRLLAWVSGGGALAWTLWRRPHHGMAACVLLGAWLSPVTWKAHLALLAIPGILAARRLAARPSQRLWAVWGVWLALIALPKLWTSAELWGASTVALALGWWWCVSEPAPSGNPPATNV